MKRLLIAALLLAGGAAIAQGPPPAPKPTTLASRPGATGGEALYVEHCIELPCAQRHGHRAARPPGPAGRCSRRATTCPRPT